MVVTIGPEHLRELTAWPDLINALQSAFRQPAFAPERTHVDIAGAGTLLIMPAWQEGGLLGVKVMQVFPGNASFGKPTLDGIYMLASATTGEVYALIHAQELTARRTAAASALASRFLSRSNSNCLLVMGTGKLAFEVICAHCSVRPIKQVLIWGRREERVASVSARVRRELGIEANAVESLPNAIAHSDIISTVTTAITPILPGEHLRPGTHIDLIGGFTPRMREADDQVVSRARIYVDALHSALLEAGDIADPLARGIIDRSNIVGDLFELCSGSRTGRATDSEITLFKSVGVALEDFAAAGLAWNLMRVKEGAFGQ